MARAKSTGHLVSQKRESSKKKPSGELSISQPSFTAFLPCKPNRSAIIICRGAGYPIESYQQQCARIAGVFNDRGVTTFIITHQVPVAALAPEESSRLLEEAQQALKLVREKALDWKIDAHRVGLLGFSAGNYLAEATLTQLATACIPNLTATNLRPDFLALIKSEAPAGLHIYQKGIYSCDLTQRPEQWMRPIFAWMQEKEWLA